MGTGLPMAIGAALANPDQPTICATGDGGVRMYVAELKLAIEHRLPMLVVLMTDGRYGSIACAPAARDLSKGATTISQPSWYRAVEALGCASVQVADSDALASVVTRWQAGDGPLFVEAVFDPERYGIMVEGVR
jgi:acetolactate synthase-1/2/3 large subunit